MKAPTQAEIRSEIGTLNHTVQLCRADGDTHGETVCLRRIEVLAGKIAEANAAHEEARRDILGGCEIISNMFEASD